MVTLTVLLWSLTQEAAFIGIGIQQGGAVTGRSQLRAATGLQNWSSGSFEHEPCIESMVKDVITHQEIADRQGATAAER